MPRIPGQAGACPSGKIETMLKIGQLDNELDARTFGDYLYVKGIENQVDPGKDG